MTSAFRVLSCLFFLTCGALPAFAQDSSSPPIQRDRFHLSAAEWQKSAKASSAIEGGDTVRLQKKADSGSVTSSVIDLPFGANAIGTHWKASVPEGTRLEVELRTSRDGETWTDWIAPPHPIPIDEAEEAPIGDASYAGDIAAGPVLTEPNTRFAQVRLILHGTGAVSPTLRRLSLYVINSTRGPPPPKDVAAPPSRPRTAGDTSKPRIYSRSEWGAQPPSHEYQHERATHLAIHHTATASAGAADSWEDCAAAVRAIQDFHMNTRGWIDIGYNYLVCQTGALFQGREDGDPGQDVVAAHDGYNDGSVGTAGLGYFHPPENQHPTSRLLDSFVDLFAWIAQRRRIDPYGTSYYVGYGRSFRNIYGHRDIKATACPGDLFYSERSTIISRVDERVDLPPSVTTISANHPNPARSQTRFELTLSSSTAVTLRVYDVLGRLVTTRHYGSFPPGTHTVPVRTANWAAGTYLYRLVMDERTKSGSIQVVH